MTEPDNTPEIPARDVFRAWLSAALAALEVKPATVARGIGASVNSVGAFLRSPERDITLSRAAQIEVFLCGLADHKGVKLPPISTYQPGGENGGGDA